MGCKLIWGPCLELLASEAPAPPWREETASLGPARCRREEPVKGGGGGQQGESGKEGRTALPFVDALACAPVRSCVD